MEYQAISLTCDSEWNIIKYSRTLTHEEVQQLEQILPKLNQSGRNWVNESKAPGPYCKEMYVDTGRLTWEEVHLIDSLFEGAAISVLISVDLYEITSKKHLFGL